MQCSTLLLHWNGCAIRNCIPLCIVQPSSFKVLNFELKFCEDVCYKLNHNGWQGAIKFKLLLHFNNFANIAIVNKVFVRSWLSPSCNLCFSHWYPLSSLVALSFQLSMSIVLILHTFCDHLKNSGDMFVIVFLKLIVHSNIHSSHNHSRACWNLETLSYMAPP